MNIKEAKRILKQNRFILEDDMHDRAMARVDRAYQHMKDLQSYDLDPLRPHHGSEDWEEVGHTEYDYTNKDFSDEDEKEEFGKKVAEKLVDYFKPIYEKRGYVPDEYEGGDDNWDWAIKVILQQFMYHAVGADEKLSFMSVDKAVKYVIPTAYKVLEQCWDKKANWFVVYKYSYIDIKEAKAILNNSRYLCEGKMLDTHENFVYLYLLLKMNGAEMQNSILDCMENCEIYIKMNGYPVTISSENNSRNNVVVSIKTGEEDGDSIDQKFSLYELISYANQNNLNAFKNTIFGYSESDDEYENDSVYGKKANT